MLKSILSTFLFGIFIIVTIFGLTQAQDSLVLQQGLNDYSGCIDSYLAQSFPNDKFADSMVLDMQNWSGG